MNIEKLCYGCMHEIENADGICPYCGFDKFAYEKIRSTRALPLGTILNGKYFLGKVLGEGGFGITYLALDLSLEIPVAIKEYFPVGLVSRDTSIEGSTEKVSVITGEKKKYYEYGMKSFSSEAKNLAKFQRTDGIISIKEFFLENGTAYLVMEYIDGKTLKQYLAEKGAPLSEEETLRLIYPILNALQKIHGEGIIHRDISPENIMLAKDGRVVLIDFGAARMSTGAETKSLTVLLKHGYAPVEQYQTQGKQGPYTDIYAICATMYRMMSGEKPQEAIDRMVEDKVVRLEIKNGPHISHAVSEAIQKGLAVQAKDRYQTVGELKEKLFEENETSVERVIIDTYQNNSSTDPKKYEHIIQEDHGGKERGIYIIIPILLVLFITLILPWIQAYLEHTNEMQTLKDEKILSQTAEKDGDNSEMPESKDIVQSTEESAAHISNDKVGTTNKKVVEMKDIVYVDELIQLLESNSDINFIKNGSYWEYKNGDTLIRIRDTDKVENVFWKNYKWLSYGGVTIGTEKEKIESVFDIDKSHANIAYIWYTLDLWEKPRKILSVRYDNGERAESLRFYGA